MKGKNLKLFLDSLMVLLNLAAARGNILLYWLFGVTQIRSVLIIVVVLDFLYLFVRFRGLFFIGNIGSSIYLLPLYFTFALIIVNYYNALREGSGFLVSTLSVLLVLLFAFIVGGLIKDYTKKMNSAEVAHVISNGYVWLSLLTVSGVFLSFFLDMLFGLQATPIDADFLESNIEQGSCYYRSFFSVLVQNTEERVPFFHQFGIFTGLFHEPQVVTHNVFPCLILMLGFAKTRRKRLIIIVSTLVFMLFSGSVTNMVVAAFCLLVYLFVKSKQRILGISFGVGLIVLFVLLVLRLDSESIMQDFVLDRLDPENRSQLYSVSMLIWSFSPRTLFGNNFLDTDYVLDIMDFGGARSDVGLIPCILFIGFILSIVFNTIRLLSVDNKLAKTVGVASLYFILHSMKIGMPMLMLTFPILLIFLQFIILQTNGRSKTIK